MHDGSHEKEQQLLLTPLTSEKPSSGTKEGVFDGIARAPMDVMLIKSVEKTKHNSTMDNNHEYNGGQDTKEPVRGRHIPDAMPTCSLHRSSAGSWIAAGA